MTAWDIARVCHEANRAYCATLGDTTQLPWDEAPEWQRQSAVAGVELALDNPALSPSDSHEAWAAQKRADGWTYGPAKDVELKRHPALVSWPELPRTQRAKDVLFLHIVDALRGEARP